MQVDHTQAVLELLGKERNAAKYINMDDNCNCCCNSPFNNVLHGFHVERFVFAPITSCHDVDPVQQISVVEFVSSSRYVDPAQRVTRRWTNFMNSALELRPGVVMSMASRRLLVRSNDKSVGEVTS
jgi:hypothetical protein